MPNALTPLARHAGMRLLQVPDRFHGTEADDASSLPWGRPGGAQQQAQTTDEHIDAEAVRKAWSETQYAKGYQDGHDVGERSGTLHGWYWGAGCGAFATALVAMIAGFLMASWGAGT
jgi:hypothetical protein